MGEENMAAIMHIRKHNYPSGRFPMQNLNIGLSASNLFSISSLRNAQRRSQKIVFLIVIRQLLLIIPDKLSSLLF